MLHIFFWALFIGGGISAFFNNAGLWVAVAGGLAPMIAWFGGSGTRGSLYAKAPQKIAGIVMGFVFLAIGVWWVEAVGFRVNVNLGDGLTIPGWQWVILAYAVGLIFTSRKFAPGGSEDAIGRRNKQKE